MQNDWILDVLVDLKAFAGANDLKALTEQLDDTILIAAAEIATKAGEANKRINGEELRSGPNSKRAGGHQRA